MISVLIPSRGRPDGLRDAVESLILNASSPDNVEILVAIDPDDGPVHTKAIELEKRHSASTIRVMVTPERYGYAQLYRYYNALAERAKGDWLLLFNDDALMTTQDWDERIKEIPPDKLIADPKHALSASYVCFPAMHRRMYEALGHFSGENPAVDSYIQDIGRALGIIQQVDVWIDHRRPDLTGDAPDATYLEGRAGLGHVHYFSPAYQAVIAEATERVRAIL